MLDTQKQELLCAISELDKHNFFLFNQGSISLCDRANNLIITHPAALPESPAAEQMLICDASGKPIEGDTLPCRSLSAHLELYRAFPSVGAIVHSHGLYTTAWAQAGRDIPVYGTGHLEHFSEAIPCTRAITPDEVFDSYSQAVGAVIAEMFQKKSLDPETIPAALVFQHGAFIWGIDANEAVSRAIALERIAHLAMMTESINPSVADNRMTITPRTNDI